MESEAEECPYAGILTVGAEYGIPCNSDGVASSHYKESITRKSGKNKGDLESRKSKDSHFSRLRKSGYEIVSDDEEAYCCPRHGGHTRLFSKYDSIRTFCRKQNAFEQRPPLQRVPVFRQPMPIRKRDFNPVAPTKQTIVRNVWMDIQRRIAGPQQIQLAQKAFSKKIRPMQRKKILPLSVSAQSKPLSKTLTKLASKSCTSAKRAQRNLSLRSENISEDGRKTTAAYVPHYEPYGIDGPLYNTLHDPLRYKWGITYQKQFEIPTLSSLLKAKDPRFLGHKDILAHTPKSSHLPSNISETCDVPKSLDNNGSNGTSVSNLSSENENEALEFVENEESEVDTLEINPQEEPATEPTEYVGAQEYAMEAPASTEGAGEEEAATKQLVTQLNNLENAIEKIIDKVNSFETRSPRPDSSTEAAGASSKGYVPDETEITQFSAEVQVNCNDSELNSQGGRFSGKLRVSKTIRKTKNRQAQHLERSKYLSPNHILGHHKYSTYYLNPFCGMHDWQNDKFQRHVEHCVASLCANALIKKKGNFLGSRVNSSKSGSKYAVNNGRMKNANSTISEISGSGSRGSACTESTISASSATFTESATENMEPPKHQNGLNPSKAKKSKRRSLFKEVQADLVNIPHSIQQTSYVQAPLLFFPAPTQYNLQELVPPLNPQQSCSNASDLGINQACAQPLVCRGTPSLSFPTVTATKTVHPPLGPLPTQSNNISVPVQSGCTAPILRSSTQLEGFKEGTDCSEYRTNESGKGRIYTICNAAAADTQNAQDQRLQNQPLDSRNIPATQQTAYYAYTPVIPQESASTDACRTNALPGESASIPLLSQSTSCAPSQSVYPVHIFPSAAVAAYAPAPFAQISAPIGAATDGTVVAGATARRATDDGTVVANITPVSTVLPTQTGISAYVVAATNAAASPSNAGKHETKVNTNTQIRAPDTYSFPVGNSTFIQPAAVLYTQTHADAVMTPGTAIFAPVAATTYAQSGTNNNVAAESNYVETVGYEARPIATTDSCTPQPMEAFNMNPINASVQPANTILAPATTKGYYFGPTIHDTTNLTRIGCNTSEVLHDVTQPMTKVDTPASVKNYPKIHDEIADIGASNILAVECSSPNLASIPNLPADSNANGRMRSTIASATRSSIDRVDDPSFNNANVDIYQMPTEPHANNNRLYFPMDVETPKPTARKVSLCSIPDVQMSLPRRVQRPVQLKAKLPEAPIKSEQPCVASAASKQLQNTSISQSFRSINARSTSNRKSNAKSIKMPCSHMRSSRRNIAFGCKNTAEMFSKLTSQNLLN